MHLTELAREHGGKPAVIMADSRATLSYAELERQSNKVAHLPRLPSGKMLRRLLMDRHHGDQSVHQGRPARSNP